MRTLRLAESVGPRSGEPRRGHHHDGTLSVEHLELAPLGGTGLVDVAREDELGAGGRELLEDSASTSERALACSPGRVRELMVKANDTQRAGGGRSELLRGALHCA